jgi:D-alanine-D-alanine ligase
VSPALHPPIVVLLGGPSAEHDVSIVSGTAIADALRERGDDVREVLIDLDGRWWWLPADHRRGDRTAADYDDPSALAADGPWTAGAAIDRLASAEAPPLVFIALHGPFGEDGTVQGLLELAGVAYVGAGVAASALCMDKNLFKKVLRESGIRVTPSVTLRAGDPVEHPFELPVFVKPARLGSSVGITKAHDEDELREGVALAFRHDEKVLIEEFVDGLEVEVGVLGNLQPIASLPGQIVPLGHEWYDYSSKYDDGGMELVIPPAGVSDATLRRVQDVAVDAFRATDCEGMARVDCFVVGDGDVVVNELNTIPGFTATSVYAKLFDASGIPYDELLRRLIELALERHERRGRLRY